MRPWLGAALALLLILRSSCGASLQDPSELGAGLNDGFLKEYSAEVPTVAGNDVRESENDHPADNDGGLAYGSMMFSGLEDAEATVSVPNLMEDEGEEPSGSLETNGTVNLPSVVKSDEYLDVNDTVEENGPMNMTAASQETPLVPIVPQQNESLSVSNDTMTNSTEASTSIEANSTEASISTQANSTVITSTEANSTVITSTEANSTEVISPTPETNRSDVTSPPSPEPQDFVTNATVNNTKDGLNPTAENPPDSEPTTVKPTTISTIKTPEDIPNDVTDIVGLPTTTTPRANATAMGKAAGDSSERGLAPGTQTKTQGKAWGAILGTALVVGIVGLIVYVLLKRRGRREFSHTKLVEETSSDPVLRLDNSEPLDLKFDGFGYYNPTLQGDNIQMTNFPAGHPQ